MDEPLRVLVVDDSPLMRQLLPALLESDSGLRVVGTAADGHEAIAMVERLRPDVITLDVRMPLLDGLATTEHIMAYCPTPILVLTASLSRYDVDITFKMLEAGALDVLEKPSGESAASLATARGELIRRIKLLAKVRVVTHLRGRRAATTRAPVTRPGGELIGLPTLRSRRLIQPTGPVIVIGASTGGPRVIQQILRGLPPSFGAPILIVQHIADSFVAGMIDWLNSSSPLPVRLATDGLPLTPGEAVMAPERRNLLLGASDIVQLSAQNLAQHTSIDQTMRSVARACGARGVGVLLTGMGDDGAAGLRAIRDAGGATFAQSQESCTVFGMPRAAIALNAAQQVLAPDAIADALKNLAEKTTTVRL
jgi:two-component system, chemotaxis family, protein-glutamate methylesterase/glutaminase